jgi:prepilin-type processing-associated H-X9-DG protein
LHIAGLETIYYRTYRYSWPQRMEEVRQLHGRPVLLDAILHDYHLIGPPAEEPSVSPHGPVRNSRRNWAYPDGHVESLPEQEFRRRRDEEGIAGLRTIWPRPATSTGDDGSARSGAQPKT